MIFRDAIISLKSDFARSFFYFLTLLLTSTFIFLFFNIMLSDPVGASFLTSKSDTTATAVTVSVIVICMLSILFANDFFVKNKAKELAVRLICGATYSQLSGFLMIQTLILLFIAIPVGIFVAIQCIPLLNQILSSILESEFLIHIQGDGVMMASFIIGFVVFWVILLNLSFAYRNAANMMLNRQIVTKTGGNLFYNAAIPSFLKNIVSFLIFALPIVFFYFNKHAILVSSALSLVGFNQCIDRIIIPFLSKRNKQNVTSHEAIVYRGFFRYDIMVIRYNLLLLLFTSILLLSALTTKECAPIEKMLYMLSYGTMNLLLSFAIMFKFASDVPSRNTYYQTVNRIGYEPHMVKNIIHKETGILYAFIVLVIGIYFGNIFAALRFAHATPVRYVTMLIGFIAIPLIICLVLSLYHYRRSIEIQ